MIRFNKEVAMSQGRLQEIMSKLHIDVISRKIDYVHDAIREEWTVKKYFPKDYEDCHRYLTKYYQYHFARYAKANVKMPDEMAFAYVREILEKSQGGYAVNIKNALKGRHGGMIALINMLADDLKKQAVEQYVGYIINEHVDPLDFPLKVELMRQYISKYARHMLPGEDLMSPYELAANLNQVIKYHVQMVNSYRNIVE
jgi:hypothetical protein